MCNIIPTNSWSVIRCISMVSLISKCKQINSTSLYKRFVIIVLNLFDILFLSNKWLNKTLFLKRPNLLLKICLKPKQFSIYRLRYHSIVTMTAHETAPTAVGVSVELNFRHRRTSIFPRSPHTLTLLLTSMVDQFYLLLNSLCSSHAFTHSVKLRWRVRPQEISWTLFHLCVSYFLSRMRFKIKKESHTKSAHCLFVQ